MRRRWTVPDTGEIITRDWSLVREGARMTREFVSFKEDIQIIILSTPI
ncbi:hypothetical protein ACR78Z_19945 [Sphingobacterium thalpophilum]